MADDPRNQENQRRQEQESSQASQNLGRMLNQQKELNEAGIDFTSILKEVIQIQKDLSREIEKQGKSQRDTELSSQQEARQRKIIENSVKNSASLASQLSKYSRQDLNSTVKKKKFLETIAKTQDDQELLLERINKLRAKETNNGGKLSDLQSQVLNALEGQYETTADILSESEKLKRSYTALGRIQAPFKGIENAVKSIPIVREAFGELTKMSEKVAETYIETGSLGKAAFAGVAQAAKGVLQTLGNAFLVGIIRGLSGLSTSSAKLQNALNLTQKEASALYSRLTAIRAFSRGTFGLEDLETAAIGLSGALGSSAIASDKTIKTTAILAQRLGISADQAASLFGFAAATNQSFTGATESIIGQTEALNEATEVSIRYSDILADIANVGAATALSTDRFPGGIAKAAFEARRLGLSLSQLEKTQSSLLDFSQSITDEINAEVLLNRSLNLDRARYFALTNDLAGLAREMYEQADGFEGFEEMLFPQQQAFARAFGMSRDEAAEAIKNRKALIDLEKEAGVELLDKTQEEQIANLIELYKKENPKIEVEDARIKALEALGLKEQALGAKTLMQQAKAIGATDRLQKELDNLGGSIGLFIARLIGVESPLDRLADRITDLTQYLHRFLIRVGFDTGVERFGGGDKKIALAMAENAQQALRGLNSVSSDQIKLLQDIASSEVTNSTPKDKIEQINLAKNTLKAIEDLRGVTEEELGRSIVLGGEKLSIAASDRFVDTIEKERKFAGSALDNLELISDAFSKFNLPPLTQNIQTGTLNVDGEEYKTNTTTENGGKVTTTQLNPSADFDDFTIRANPKDTLVMAGGTRFGEETNKLLERLINAVERGGSVYLDGRKVGEALVINTTRQ